MEAAASGFWSLVLIAVIGGLVVAICGGLAGFFLWLTYKRYDRILAKPAKPNFKKLRTQIEGKDTLQTAYQSLLEGFLDKIDWFFDRWGDEDEESSTNHAPGRPLTWTANAYDRCLLLAVAYPIMSAFLTWLLLNQTGALGEALGLLPLKNDLFRFVMSLGLGGIFWLFVRLLRREDWQKWVLIFVLPAVLLAFIADEAIGIIVLGTASGGFISVGVAACVVTLAVVSPGGSAGTFIGTFAGAGAGAVAGSVALAFLGTSLGAGVIAFVVAFAGGHAVIKLFLRFSRRRRFFGPALVALTALLFGAGWLAAGIAAMGDEAGYALGVLLAIFLFPLLNAPFDWASLGLTRFLLRKNLEARSAWSRARLSLTDFGLALIALVVLALTLILALEVFNARVRPALGHDFVNVRAQLEAIGAKPGNPGHVWIYFTLFSTLIPTLLHAIIWCASLVTVRVPGLRARILAGIERLDDGEGTRMMIAAALTLRWVIAIVAVVFGVALLWIVANLAPVHLGPRFLDLLLWWQATVAGWLA
ncbi:hypothetical protein [Rhodospira trueperi]|uniref:Uncharacterized protein n=1 Tax=Rhodospira trueperi TaxID=69960 RepID=A0A1G7BN18_9PROT|nr:hypothetical protein [Rhodospira trueperi]SDE27826.1 hypothetical protein SAMN05421720_10585 [Rhodospira trueperi]